MWIYTRYGFISAAVEDGTINTIKVRARSLRHMKQLQVRFRWLVKFRILYNVGTDYPVRIYLTRTEFAKLLSDLAQDLDYSNFKDTLHNDPKYLRAAVKAYNAVHELQWGGK